MSSVHDDDNVDDSGNGEKTQHMCEKGLPHEAGRQWDTAWSKEAGESEITVARAAMDTDQREKKQTSQREPGMVPASA